MEAKALKKSLNTVIAEKNKKASEFSLHSLELLKSKDEEENGSNNINFAINIENFFEIARMFIDYIETKEQKVLKYHQQLKKFILFNNDKSGYKFASDKSIKKFVEPFVLESIKELSDMSKCKSLRCKNLEEMTKKINLFVKIINNKGELNKLIEFVKIITSVNDQELIGDDKYIYTPTMKFSLKTFKVELKKEYVLFQTSFDPILTKDGQLKTDEHPEKFLSLLYDYFEEPEKVDFFLQLIAYSLLPNNPFKIAMIWLGRRDSGKTTLANIIQAIFGNYAISLNTAVLDPKKEDVNPFLIEARNTRIAFISELKGNKAISSSLIKRITGGDCIVCRALYSNNILQFPAKFLPVIITNELPKFDTEDEALFSRLVFIPFTKTFPLQEGLVEKIVNKEGKKIITLLFQKLTHILQNRINLKQMNPWKIENIRLIYQKDKYSAFFLFCCHTDQWKETSLDEATEKFKKFCSLVEEKEDIMRIDDKIIKKCLGRAFRKQRFSIERKTISGKKIRVIKNTVIEIPEEILNLERKCLEKELLYSLAKKGIKTIPYQGKKLSIEDFQTNVLPNLKDEEIREAISVILEGGILPW